MCMSINYMVEKIECAKKGVDQKGLPEKLLTKLA